MPDRRRDQRIDKLVMALAWILILSGLVPLMLRAASDEEVNISLNAAAQRPIESSTMQAVQKQYQLAWKNLEVALQQNNADLLNEAMVGTARERYAAQIKDQQRGRVQVRLIDHGHNAKAVFYSHEGSAIQLQDVAQLEIQILDGSKVISSENKTLNYLALLTVVDDRWKVRVLEAVPNF